MVDWNDYEHTMRDLRVGMGIGGWDMEHTLTHKPTGLIVVWESHGSNPRHKFRHELIELLDMVIKDNFYGG